MIKKKMRWKKNKGNFNEREDEENQERERFKWRWIKELESLWIRARERNSHKRGIKDSLRLLIFL